VMGLSAKLQVKPSRSFFDEMNQTFGMNCVEASYRACQGAGGH